MKILLSGYHNPHYLTVTEYIERAVRCLGHELIVFNDRDHFIPGRLRKRWKPLQAMSLAVINLNLVKLAVRTRPDIIIVTGGHRVTQSGLRSLIRRGFRVALWTTDSPKIGDLMRATAFDYHFIFCQGTEYVEIFRDLGITAAQWLPMACDPQIHHPVQLSNDEACRFGSDVVSVGSYYPRRAEYLAQLVGFDLAIWGPGWEELSADSPLRTFIRGAHTPSETWVKIYSASKIVLSVHVRDPHKQFLVHQASPRIFEALACGAFVLTDRQRDVLSLFKDGEHLVAFADRADLVRKVVYFLDHADERRRIAEAGRREVLNHHTYEHRVLRLLTLLETSALPPVQSAKTDVLATPYPIGD